MAVHGHVDPSNRKVALLIAVLAAVLAFSETLGKSAQTEAISRNVEASNLWAFFQAKTIRMTTLRTAAEALEIDLMQPQIASSRPALEKRIAEWRANAERYDSEPQTQEGRKELAARAKSAEQRRDHAMAAYHYYELGSGALQLAIVLASANVITGAAFLLWASSGLGIAGVILALLGLLAPTAIHFL